MRARWKITIWLPRAQFGEGPYRYWTRRGAERAARAYNLIAAQGQVPLVYRVEKVED